MIDAVVFFLRRYWREIALLLVVAGVVFLGWSMRGIAAERDAAKAAAFQESAQVTALQTAMAGERKANASQAAADAKLQQGLQDENDQLQAAVDRLHAAIGLRGQPGVVGRVHSVAACVGQCDSKAGGDFLAAHGEDALRLAAEADGVVKQLTACQEILASDRAAANQ